MKESVKLQTAVNNIIQPLDPPPPPSPSPSPRRRFHAVRCPPQDTTRGKLHKFPLSSARICCRHAITWPLSLSLSLSSPPPQNATRAVRRGIQFPFVRRRHYLADFEVQLKRIARHVALESDVNWASGDRRNLLFGRRGSAAKTICNSLLSPHSNTLFQLTRRSGAEMT